MQIHPARRRRALRVHYLQQRGDSLRKIAEQLGVSHTTVRDDLRLLESHWSSIAAPAADDLLLESLQLLQFRLVLATRGDEVARLSDRLTPGRIPPRPRRPGRAVDRARARDPAHCRRGSPPRRAAPGPTRPRRRTAANPGRSPPTFHSLTARIRRSPSAEQEIVEIPAPEEKLPSNPIQPTPPDRQAEAAPTPAETAEVSTALQSESTIASAEREIVEIPAPAGNTSFQLPSNSPSPPAYDELLNEVIDHFPQLKGQSEEQILAFLDQFTSLQRGTHPNPDRSRRLTTLLSP